MHHCCHSDARPTSCMLPSTRPSGVGCPHRPVGAFLSTRSASQSLKVGGRRHEGAVVPMHGAADARVVVRQSRSAARLPGCRRGSSGGGRLPRHHTGVVGVQDGVGRRVGRELASLVADRALDVAPGWNSKECLAKPTVWDELNVWGEEPNGEARVVRVVIHVQEVRHWHPASHVARQHAVVNLERNLRPPVVGLVHDAMISAHVSRAATHDPVGRGHRRVPRIPPLAAR
mmetsp:Transcript_18930/g.56243  ORF Transcript_18930/g.56243 Transcript_18930/m.56243 type:complete len:230 (+) Transcript_18930:41-730(+)